MKIELGSEVKDNITGFTGITIARTEWLYGCVRIVVQGKELHDGKPVDAQTFDEQQLQVLHYPTCGTTVIDEPTKPGGARPEATRQPAAIRR